MRAFLLGAVLLLQCGGAGSPLPPAVSPPIVRSGESPHALVTLSVGCWLDGPWGAALADPHVRDRCVEVVLRGWGQDDAWLADGLRTLEPSEIGALRARLVELGADRSLVATFDGIARARRETLLSKRAAVRAAIGAADDALLEQSDGLLALVGAQVGNPTLEMEGRTIAILSAIERVDAVRDLPRHVKVRAVGGIFHALYGVPPPDPKLDAMGWLRWIEAAASAGGHGAKTGALEERETAAWDGARAGLVDELRRLSQRLPSSEIRRAAIGTVMRLDTERQTARDDAPSDLVARAMACWLDGSGRSCRVFAHTVYDDPERAFAGEDALRWAEPRAVDEVLRKTGASRRQALLAAAGDAAREGVRVRAAATALAHDADQPVLVDTIGQSKKLALLLDLGDQSSEANALGLLFAADRVEMARGLPEDLEWIVVAPVRRFLRTPVIGFFVDWREDGTELERATLGEAIADRLRPLANEAPLSDLTRSVVLRLDTDYRAARARYVPETDWSDP